MVKDNNHVSFDILIRWSNFFFVICNTLSFEKSVNDDPSVIISVIVPIYKVEKYLTRCLNSLLIQDLEQVEFILVDDGSPDCCGEICEKFAKLDNRFKVFHKENGGLSSARNFGIEHSNGEYIMFVDSDDWVSSDFCRTAYSAALNHNSDLIMFNYQIITAGNEIKPQLFNRKEGKCNWQEGIDLLLGQVGVYAWNKLYKRSLFEEIRYPEGRLFEDSPTTWKLLSKAENIYFIEEILYFYYMRNDSILHQPTLKAFQDRFEMKKQFFDGVSELGYSTDKISYALLPIVLGYAVKVKRSSADPVSEQVYKILNSYDKIPDNLSWKQKIIMFIYLKNVHLFDFLCDVTGRRLTA